MMQRLVHVSMMLMVTIVLGGCAASSNMGGGESCAASSYHAVFPHGAVAADHPQASQAGSEVLAMGGNAVDAAVATSFALSVVRPESCGIGGGGFMVISLNQHPKHGDVEVAINYRECAPLGASPTMYESLEAGASEVGGRAVAVPGTVAGLLHALKKYGTLDRATVLAPAIRLASEGWLADANTEKSLKELAEVMASTEHDDAAAMAKVREIYGEPGAPLAGRRIRNEPQARALRLIAEQGLHAFQQGEIAVAILRTVNRDGAGWGYEDLQSHQVVEMQPLRGTFQSNTIMAMPLPSSGGLTILQVLALLEARPDLVERAKLDRVAWVHLLTECFKHAFADRALYLADPTHSADFTDAILNPSRLRTKAGMIDATRTYDAAWYAQAAPIPADHGTSHLSVVDQWGGAVACTETINLEWGSKVFVPEFGFFLNNQMDDFQTRAGQANAFGLVQSDRNLPAPGKRPLSSMSPIIVRNEYGEVILVAGASGGPRIITGTIQVMLNLLLFELAADEAMVRQRVHHQWMPDLLKLETRELTSRTIQPVLDVEDEAGLRTRGHVLEPLKDSSAVQVIWRSPAAPDAWLAASDPRKGGRPAGH